MTEKYRKTLMKTGKRERHRARVEQTQSLGNLASLNAFKRQHFQIQVCVVRMKGIQPMLFLLYFFTASVWFSLK